MQVKSPIAHCPFLLQTDELRLTSHFRITARGLEDTTVGACHVLHGPATLLLASMDQGVRYGHLQGLARQKAVNSTQLQELLGFLNLIGGLERKKRNWIESAQALQCIASHLIVGIHFRPISFRYTYSLRRMFQASLRATTPVILAAGVVASLNVAAGLLSSRNTLAIAVCLLTFVCSIVFHETGHRWIIARQHMPADILQKGLRIGLVHRKLPPNKEILSALTGPGAGVSICVLVACIAINTQQPVTAYGSLIIAMFHIISLVPFYDDGSSLLAALKERHHRKQ